MAESDASPCAMDPALARWRAGERRRLRRARLALAPAERAAHEAALVENVRRLLAERGPADLAFGFYWPFQGEADLRPLARELVAAGATAALPAVVGRDRPLEFRRWDPKVALAPGALGIPAPPAGPALRPDLLLVPLIGFDGANHRLGFGGGFYDRTLATLAPRPFTVGIGFELGRLETIRPQPHDVPLDRIVTEAGIQPGP